MKVTVKQVSSPPPKKKSSPSLKWVIALIVVIILAIVGYRQIYLPHTIKSVIFSNDFTTTKGYTPAVDFSKRTIILYASNQVQSQYGSDLAANGYDTRKIEVESQLAGLAHDIAGKTFGEWQIAIATKSAKGSAVLWQYDGTKEAKRFQTSSEGKQLREQYLEQQRAAQRQAEQQEQDEKLGAGLLGGGIGLLIGGL